MHAPSAYEHYLMREQRRYGWSASDDNDFPAWLILEQETYYWIFYLSRSIREPLYYSTVSKQMLERIEKIPTIRFLRYRDISPSLKKAISDIAAEFASLHEDLKSPEMWIRSHLLSKTGLERWERTAELVGECRYVVPDPEWRENWEKKNVAPLCTRLEAELIAKEFIFNNTGIDLSEIDPKDGKLKYYCFRYAKNGCFKLRFGEWGELNHPYNDIGTVVVDMLTKEAEMISPDNGDQ